jgi:hypothetical protein
MLKHLTLPQHSALPDRPITSEGRAIEVGNHPDEDDAEANKQRRKIQNRKNQRAHRLRTREQASSSVQRSRPFQVTRWRLDEHFDDTKDTAALSIGHRPLCPHIRAPAPEIVEETGIAIGRSNSPIHTTLTPPSLTFPLSTDHLLHLVQYNVFRAFVSNKQTLNLLLTGQTERRMSPTTCPSAVLTATTHVSSRSTLTYLPLSLRPCTSKLIPTLFGSTSFHFRACATI